jgi:hypothetical protein
MAGVENRVSLCGQNGGRHPENSRSTAVQPRIAPIETPLRADLQPLGGELANGPGLLGHAGGNLDRQQNQIRRDTMGLNVYQTFQDGQSAILCGVHRGAARPIPPSSGQPRTFAGQVRVGRAGEAVNDGTQV